MAILFRLLEFISKCGVDNEDHEWMHVLLQLEKDHTDS